MKAIATVNFKGGVGKTTVTWLLAKYVAERKRKKVLVIDTDAQMSMTLAVQLNEERGDLDKTFETWYDTHIKGKKTLLDAIDTFERLERGHFDFPIDNRFVYQMSNYLFFVPSIVDLYWLELEIFDRRKIKGFVSALLGKMEHSRTFKFDYVFFDCPPNFTPLSYSVLSCSSLLLIPVNPDVFAARGVKLLIEGLEMRIEPWPDPLIRVFMNKAKLRLGSLTRESLAFFLETKNVCNEFADNKRIRMLNTVIPDRVDIKRAIPRAEFPSHFEDDFSRLWSEIEESLEKGT